MKKILAGILATSILSTVALSAAATDYIVNPDKTVTGGTSNPMVEAPVAGGVPYGTFSINNEDSVQIPAKGSIGLFGGGNNDGTNPDAPPVYPTSPINISMPLRLAFGNYSDATAGASFSLTQDANKFYSGEYTITNNTVATTGVGAKNGKIKVDIVAAQQTGTGISLAEEASLPTTYAANQMRVGIKVESGFTGTSIPTDLAVAAATAGKPYKNGVTPANTASLKSIIDNADITTIFELGELDAATQAGSTVNGTEGKFKIMGDSSKLFPTTNVQDDFTVTFKFSAVTP